MTPDDLTPERLDAILNGSEPPTSDAERDMLALAASLRDAAPRASEDLRDRVRAIAEPAATGGETGRRSPGWRTRLLVAGPAIATVVAAVVVIAVVGGDDPGTNRTSLTRESAGSAGSSAATTTRSATSAAARALSPSTTAPEVSAGPTVVRIEPGTLQQRIADARRIVAAADGTAIVSVQTAAEPSALLTITLPTNRAPGALAKLMRLGNVGERAATGPDGTVRLLLTEQPSP